MSDGKTEAFSTRYGRNPQGIFTETPMAKFLDWLVKVDPRFHAPDFGYYPMNYLRRQPGEPIRHYRQRSGL